MSLGRMERSTAPRVLAGIARDHPALWRLMQAEIERLASDESEPLHGKARFVSDALAGARAASSTAAHRASSGP